MIQEKVVVALSATGAGEIKSAAAGVAKLEAELRMLSKVMASGGSTPMLRQEMQQLEKQLTAAQRSMAMTGAAATSVNAAMGRAGGPKNYGMALMNVATFADDAQYGLRAVVNQIPMLLTSFGMGMGLAGAVSIVAVGVNQLVNHWDDLIALWDGGASMTEAERLGKLAESTALAASEQERLNKASGRQKAKAGLISSPIEAPEEKERAGLVKEAIAAMGGSPKLIGQLSAAMTEKNMPIDRSALEEGTRSALEKAENALRMAETGRVVMMGTGGATTIRSEEDIAAARSELGIARQRARTDMATGLVGDAEADAEGQTALTRIMEQLGLGVGGLDMKPQAVDELEGFLAGAEQWAKFIGEEMAESLAIHKEAADEKARLDQLENDRQIAMQQQRLDMQEEERRKLAARAAENFGGVFASGLMTAMAGAAGQGEKSASVDARLREQVAARMQSVPEAARGDAAAALVEDARRQFEERAAAQGALGDIQAANRQQVLAQLAGQGRAGIAMAQMMGLAPSRMGLQAAQMGRMPMAPWMNPDGTVKGAEVVSLSSMASKVQSATMGGENIPKKQLTIAEKQLAALLQIAGGDGMGGALLA